MKLKQDSFGAFGWTLIFAWRTYQTDATIMAHGNCNDIVDYGFVTTRITKQDQP